jgi:hypothetical protein
VASKVMHGASRRGAGLLNEAASSRAEWVCWKSTSPHDTQSAALPQTGAAPRNTALAAGIKRAFACQPQPRRPPPSLPPALPLHPLRGWPHARPGSAPHRRASPRRRARSSRLPARVPRTCCPTTRTSCGPSSSQTTPWPCERGACMPTCRWLLAIGAGRWWPCGRGGRAAARFSTLGLGRGLVSRVCFDSLGSGCGWPLASHSRC